MPYRGRPPEFEKADFADETYWRLRGKWNCPREEFILCASGGSDATCYVGWAGWNHLERSQALAKLFHERKQDGWEKEQLAPILSALVELVPWVKQWHNDPDAAYDGERMGDGYEAFVSEKARELGMTLDDLRNWRPQPKQPRLPKAKKPKAASTSGAIFVPKRARRKKAADDTAE
jgi:hypothetical protein